MMESDRALHPEWLEEATTYELCSRYCDYYEFLYNSGYGRTEGRLKNAYEFKLRQILLELKRR